MPTKGDFYKIIFSAEGKAVGKTVQLIEQSTEEKIMWLCRTNEPLDTVGGTKETLVWVPFDWLEPMETFKV
jgi:hypothetical protein